MLLCCMYMFSRDCFYFPSLCAATNSLNFNFPAASKHGIERRLKIGAKLLMQ